MNIQLSDHFSYGRLIRFTIPSVIMMVFTSIYSVVDGIFVSNFVGKTPFAALNLIYPVLQAMTAIGFMFGTGGSALVAKTLGEGKKEKANRIFSLLVYVSVAIGVIIAVVGIFALRPVAIALGAEGEMVDYCVIYGSVLLPAVPAFLLQNEFQSFLIAAEKPKLGLLIVVAAGLTNIVLDALFIAVFEWGLAGAALATAMSQCVGGLIPLLYFIFTKSSVLKLGKTEFDVKALLHASVNGSSEMMTNLSMSIVNILYNFQLMRIAGEDGIAAYGVIMYLNFIFVAIFIGYSLGSAPIVSYHYGAQNHDELKSLFKKSLTVIAVCSVMMAASGVVLARPLSTIFVGYDASLLDMTSHGMAIFSLSFAFTGLNIFGSAFFTALNNGLVSALISFLRTLVFQSASILIFPHLLGLDGVWGAIIAAEFVSAIVVVFFFIRKRPEYNY